MAKTKGKIGNTSPNQRARLGYGSIKKPRIMRALDPFTYKTAQRQAPGATTIKLDKPEVSKNTFYQRGRPITRRKGAVRRLFRRDPYNVLSATAPPPFGTSPSSAIMSDEANQFTNNPNLMYHPEKEPGAVGVKRQPQATPGTKNRGNVMRPNRFTLFGGKTLRRR